MTHAGKITSDDAHIDEGSLVQLETRLDALERENRLLRVAVAELERVAQRDTLTPLYNRRYFLTALNAAIARAERYGEDSALIFCDVNGLKRINDDHGHGAGDYALVLIAERLSAAVRTADTVARLGGDEFGMILEKTGSELARYKVATLTKALSEPCHYNGHDLMLSAAFGIVAISAGNSAEALLELADKAMYDNKLLYRAKDATTNGHG